jgi:hypothetical protein
MPYRSLPALFAAAVIASSLVPAAQASQRDDPFDAAVQQFSAEQIALAVEIRRTSADPLVVALARSMEVAHRRMQRRIAAHAPATSAAPTPALSDRDYVEHVLDAHRALLARCGERCGDDDAVAGVLRSRIAMAQAMQHELAGRDRNFYTALESTD